MLSDIFDHDEKMLPVDFTQGYIDAIISVIGLGLFTSALKEETVKRFHISYPDIEGQINSVINYYNNNFRYPIQYTTLRLIYKCIEYILYGGSDPRMIDLTRKIGRTWWNPAPPLEGWRFLRKVSLFDLLSKPISSELQQLRFDREYVGLSQILVSVFKTFSKELGKEAKIDCNLSETSTGISLSFNICPFCVDQTPQCQIFRGAIDGMLAWLHGDNRQSLVYSVNEELSEAHKINIDALLF